MDLPQIRKTVAIFCSADVNVSESLKIEAHKIGEYLGKQKYEILLGGTESGLMRSVTDGYMIGSEDDPNKLLKIVMPEVFRKYADLQHSKVCVDEIIWVDSIRDQLETFEKLAQNVIILPGGYGTFLELFHFLAHKKNYLIMNTNVYLYNPNGFFNHLLSQLDVMLKENTLKQKERDNLIVLNSINDLKNQF